MARGAVLSPGASFLEQALTGGVLRWSDVVFFRVDDDNSGQPGAAGSR
jgi:hypothetical protein